MRVFYMDASLQEGMLGPLPQLAWLQRRHHPVGELQNAVKLFQMISARNQDFRRDPVWPQKANRASLNVEELGLGCRGGACSRDGCIETVTAGNLETPRGCPHLLGAAPCVRQWARAAGQKCSPLSSMWILAHTYILHFIFKHYTCTLFTWQIFKLWCSLKVLLLEDFTMWGTLSKCAFLFWPDS